MAHSIRLLLTALAIGAATFAAAGTPVAAGTSPAAPAASIAFDLR